MDLLINENEKNGQQNPKIKSSLHGNCSQKQINSDLKNGMDIMEIKFNTLKTSNGTKQINAHHQNNENMQRNFIKLSEHKLNDNKSNLYCLYTNNNEAMDSENYFGRVSRMGYQFDNPRNQEFSKKLKLYSSSINLKSKEFAYSRKHLKFNHKSNIFSRSLFTSLKDFFTILFTYQPLCKEDFEELKINEILILKFILRCKNYQLVSKLTPILEFRKYNYSIWFEFYKPRRKEENLKFGFKWLIQYMYQKFSDCQKLNVNNYSLEHFQILFYYFYFFNRTFTTSLVHQSYISPHNDLNKNLKFNRLKDQVKDFIFPENISKCPFTSLKTINKDFLIKMAGSKVFIRDIMNHNLEFVLFLGFCITHDWGNCQIDKYHTSSIILTGISFMRIICKENLKDIKQIFYVWDKKISPNLRNQHGDSPNSSILKIIQKNIQRKNFKFPWSFKEVHTSFVESFLCIIEIYKVHYFKNSIKGSFNKFSKM